ncbi:MAG: DNA repair protein RecO [Candidatus Syntrophosphaera sp.]
MRSKVTDRGILAKTSAYGESSLILKAFTRGHGMISMIAKGIRKKPGAETLSPVNDYELVLYEPGEGGLYLLSEFSLAREYDLSHKAECWAASECALELYGKLIIPQDENPHYYDLLHDLFAYLESLDKNAILIWWRFLLRIYSMLGIPFRTDLCSHCGYRGKNIAAYEKGSARLVCPDCLDTNTDPERYTILTSQSSRVLALLPRIGDFVNSLTPTRQSVSQLNQLFADYYQDHFNRRLELRSLGVLEQFYR